MAEGSLTDWITAAATAFTGVVAAVSAWTGVVINGRERARATPAVEPEAAWLRHPRDGWRVMVTLRVINRLDEALIVDRITIRKPKRALLRHWETALADLPAAATLRPAGRASAVFQIGRRNASATFGGGEIVIYVIPPAGWSSGMIRLDLRISSKAATLRDRRIVVHAMTSAKPSSTTDENASMTS